MPDPYRKVQLGDPAPHSKLAYNAMIDAARAEKERKGTISAEALTQTRQNTIVRVINESGRDLLRNSILGLDDTVFTPTQSEDAFLRESLFRGEVPTVDHIGKFAITLDPILDGRTGRAYVSGVCPVLVDVVDYAHTCAEMTVGATDALKSTDSGSAQILWREGGTGDDYVGGEPYYDGLQWALVRFGFDCGIEIGIAVGAITAHSGSTMGIGSAVIQSVAGRVLTNDGRTVSTMNIVNKTIASGSRVVMVRSGGMRIVVAVGDCANLS